MGVSLISRILTGQAAAPAKTNATQRYQTNPMKPGLLYNLDNLDKTYGQSPVTTGSGVGDGFDSNRWYAKFGC